MLRGFVLLNSVGLAGCAAFAPHPDLSQPLRGAWRNAPNTTLASRAAPVAPWWQSLNSDPLNTLVNNALRTNLGLAAARERLIAARTLRTTASIPFEPSLGLNTGSEPTPGAAASYFQAGFDARWELPLFDRRANAAQLLQADAMNAEAALGDARVTLIAETVRTFLDARASIDAYELWRKLQTNADEQLRRISARIAAGFDDVDVQAQAQRELTEATTGMQRMLALRSQCAERLAALLGRSEVDDAWTADSSHGSSMLNAPPLLPADMVRARPDVRRAEAAVTRAAAELGIARAELYPHISLVGALTGAMRISSGVGTRSNGVVSAGPAISLPLFDWGLRRSQISVRGAQLRAAILEYRQVVLDAVAECEISLSRLANVTQRLAAVANSARSANALAQRSATRRRLGLLGQLGALDGERESLVAQIAVREAEYEQAIAIVQLHKALCDTRPSLDEELAAW
jgi:NodT family efflux transporter outer membrane factor (OMF) lipoprotein